MNTFSRLQQLINMVAPLELPGTELDKMSTLSVHNEVSRTLSSDSDNPEQLKKRVAELEQELELVRSKGKVLSQEVDLFRQRRVVFWSDRFRNSFNAWNLMNPGFQQLKDDSALFNGSIGGYRLQPSLSLLRVAYLTYKVSLKRANLKGILLAPIVDVPLTSGEICIRIFSEPDTFLASSVAAVAEIRDDLPTLFEFPTIKDTDKCTLNFTVHVQGVDAPVRIFELRRYALSGLGRLSRKPFAAYLFEN